MCNIQENLVCVAVTNNQKLTVDENKTALKSEHLKDRKLLLEAKEEIFFIQLQTFQSITNAKYN